MTPWEIWHTGKDKMGLFSDKIAGKTPWQTLKSKLSVHVRSKGNRSEFVRTSPGHFYLRDLVKNQITIYDDPLYEQKLTHTQISTYEAPRLRPPTEEENVLVFPSSLLDKIGRFQGIHTRWQKVARYILDPKVCRYIPRLAAEENTEHKQVLTYVMVCRGRQVLAFKRGTYTSVEEFLRGSHCIGFGGHVAEKDYDLFGREWLGIKRCAARELAEELNISASDRNRLLIGEGLSCVGILNDDSSEVGRKHFAFVFRYDVKESLTWNNPVRGEKAITQLRWLDMDPPKFSIRGFEYWSQLCLRTFFKTVVNEQPSYVIRRHRPLIPPHILCIVGPIGSGKTETSAVLKEDYGYTEINSGQILAELIGVRPVPKTPRKLFQSRALKFISQKKGPAHLAAAILRKAKLYGSRRILVDGLRQVETLSAIRKQARKAKIGVLYVHTSPDLAYKFHTEREMGDTTINEFFSQRDDDVERDVENMLPQADGVLYNWQGRPMYRKSIHAMMNELGVSC